MCQSIEEGGQRCAAHTRPAYLAALERVGGAVGDPAAYNVMFRERWELTDEAAGVARAVAEYASTREGSKATEEFIAEHKAAHGNSNKFAMFVTRARREGLVLAEANKVAAAEIRKEKVRRERAARNSMNELREDLDLPLEKSLEFRYPALAAMWIEEKNGGVSPRHVSAKANAGVYLRCPEGHEIHGRLNNYANYADVGRRPTCRECNPRRERQFVAAREELESLVAAVGDDAEAFECLSGATQYQLLSKMGLTRAPAGSVQRDLAMNIVHGNVTLAEVMASRKLSTLNSRMQDIEDEASLREIPDDLDLPSDTRRAERDDVDQIMGSAGVLALVDEGSDLARSVMRENEDALWARAYLLDGDEEGFAGFVAQVEAARGRSVFADRLGAGFLADVERARGVALPDGYAVERVMRDGSVRSFEPTLAQRRFMTMVEDRGRVMNWSGVGAGKTIATALSVQASGARETLVVAPNAVTGQWAAEFRDGFPGRTEVRFGLPDGSEGPVPDGVNRVWIANYEKFQNDPDGVRARIAGLAGRVDAVVFDEIHMAKVTDVGSASQRHGVLQSFTDEAGRVNPNLVVVGASATPVVNNLEEARSVLRLVEGPDSVGFATKPTIKNATAAYQRLSGAGMRQLPKLSTGLVARDVTVDITDSVHAVHAQVNAMQQRSGSKQVHAAMMERALLPTKLPAIVEAVRGASGPSVVYTEYTKGMVAPMREALAGAGLRVGEYTGDQSVAERAESLAAFRRGEIDVMIGSRPITTGVDGLQDVCSNMVVASMPWTSSADEQLVGRLNRRGQQRDVTVTYVLAEATVGKARWSWCKDNRQRRLRFKRSLSDAAVDGIVPDGTLDDGQRADGALAQLAALKKALVQSRAA